MTQRTPEDLTHELQAIDAAHAQNEAGRDAFIALGHTALFAASVSFVGEVAPLADAIWKPILIAGWTADVIGLLALTASFVVARHTIDARRAALYDRDPPSALILDLLNAAALWSFPAALVFLFAFVTANVVHPHDPEKSPSPVAVSITIARNARCGPASESAEPRRPIDPLDRNRSRTESAEPAPSTATARQKVGSTATDAHKAAGARCGK